MPYLDTSVIVAAITLEPRTTEVQEWLGRQTDLCISPWVETEVASALSIKLRTGAITLENRAASLMRWQGMQADSLTSLPIEPGCFETAAIFADRHELCLRAGDALHLAIASAHGQRIATLDRAMAEAAPHLGVPVAPI